MCQLPFTPRTVPSTRCTNTINPLPTSSRRVSGDIASPLCSQSSIGITIGLPLGSLHTRRDARNEAGARGSPASCSLFRSFSVSVSISVSLSLYLSSMSTFDTARRPRHRPLAHASLADGFGARFLFFFLFFCSGSLTSTVTHGRFRTSFRFGGFTGWGKLSLDRT